MAEAHASNWVREFFDLLPPPHDWQWTLERLQAVPRPSTDASPPTSLEVISSQPVWATAIVNNPQSEPPAAMMLSAAGWLNRAEVFGDHWFETRTVGAIDDHWARDWAAGLRLGAILKMVERGAESHVRFDNEKLEQTWTEVQTGIRRAIRRSNTTRIDPLV